MLNTPYGVDLNELDNDQLRFYFAKVMELPPAIGKIIGSFSTAEFIEDQISRVHNLTPPQKKTLTRIVRDVLLADIFIGNLAETIAKNLEVPGPSASAIAQLLIEKLFAPIANEIKIMHEQKFKKPWSPPQFSPTTTLDVNTINLRQ